MKKITLKELAPYLTYGLNWDLSETEYGKIEKHRLTECKLISISVDDLFTPIGLRTNIEAHNKGIMFVNLNTGKPILRPLSYLTKEIEYNGTGGKLSILDKYVKLAQQGCAFLLPYSEFEILLKFHFDVFSLIDKGLAIDINTLK